jgi:hypothetical protein
MGVRKIIHADMDAYSDGSADEVVLQQATLPRFDSSLEKLIGHDWAFYSATNLQIAINRGANPKINFMELRIWMSQEFPKLLTDKLLHLAESFLQFRQIVNCICQRDRIVGGLQTIFSLH